jgi:hypothetical protein
VARLSPCKATLSKAAEVQGIIEAAIKNYGRLDILADRSSPNHPELFEVVHEYEFGDFQKAIQHVSSPGNSQGFSNL